MIEKYIADFDFAIILFISQLVRTECGSRRRRGLLTPKTEAWSNTGKKRFAAEEDIDFLWGFRDLFDLQIRHWTALWKSSAPHVLVTSLFYRDAGEFTFRRSADFARGLAESEAVNRAPGGSEAV